MQEPKGETSYDSMSSRYTRSVDPTSQSDAGSSRSRSVGLPTILSGVASSFCSSNGAALHTGAEQHNSAHSFEDDESSDSAPDDDSTDYSLGALRRRLEKLKAAHSKSSGSSTDSPWIDVSDSSSSSDSSINSHDDETEKNSRVKFDDGNATAISQISGADDDLTLSSSPTRLRQQRLQRQRHRVQSPRNSYDASKDPEGRVCREGDINQPVAEAGSSDGNLTLASAPRQVRGSRQGRRQPLTNVGYFPSVDVASSDRDLSTVEPIRAADARPAFNKKLPREIPIANCDSDDVSSIGQSRYKNASTIPRKVNKMDLIDEESGSGNTSRATREIAKQSEPLSMSCCVRRFGTEAFFVLLITIAMTALVILIAVLVSRRN
jgi:hypothetical protein